MWIQGQRTLLNHTTTTHTYIKALKTISLPLPVPPPPPQVYVTHRLREHGALVWDLISSQGAHVYVSGAAGKMPAGVTAALEDVAAENGGMATDAAVAFVRQLELTGRYRVEAWA